jgi:hypothetical protein
MCTTAPTPQMDLRQGPVTHVGETLELCKALQELDGNAEWSRSQESIRREVWPLCCTFNWHSSPPLTCQNEQKTELLVKSFYQTAKGRKLTAEEALPLIHALLLYNSASFLSENQTEKLAGEMYLATITSARRLRGFDPPSWRADCHTFSFISRLHVSLGCSIPGAIAPHLGRLRRGTGPFIGRNG